MDSLAGGRKREENEKRRRLFAELAAVEERVLAGSTTSGSTHDATEALDQANALLDSDFVISDIKSANRMLDFCENALTSCSDGVGGVISVKDIVNAFDRDYTQFTSSDNDSDLKEYCLNFASMFVSCPLWMCLKTSIESHHPRGQHDQTQMDNTQKERKRRSVMQSREEMAAERQANQAAEEANDAERAAADERDLETMKEINRVRKKMLDALHQNGQQALDYWQFVFDPSSKGATFMNMLHVNHILLNKDQPLCLVQGSHEDSLFLFRNETISNQTQQPLSKCSVPFTLTDDLYQRLTQAYGESGR